MLQPDGNKDEYNICMYVMNMYVHTETYILCILLQVYKIRKLVRKAKQKHLYLETTGDQQL